MRRRGAAGVLRGRDAMLTSLSLAAGCVDAVGYLGLGQVFVANRASDPRERIGCHSSLFT